MRRSRRQKMKKKKIAMVLPFILFFFVVPGTSESVFKDCQITKILKDEISSDYPLRDNKLELKIYIESNDESEFYIQVCLHESRIGELCDSTWIKGGAVTLELISRGLLIRNQNSIGFILTPSFVASGSVSVRISPIGVSAVIASNYCKDCPFDVLKQHIHGRDYPFPEKGSVDLLTHPFGNLGSVTGIYLGGECLLLLLHNGASSSSSCPKYSVEGSAILSLKRAKHGVRIRLSGEDSFIPFQIQSKEGLQVRALNETEIVSSYMFYGECEVFLVANGTRSPDYLVQEKIDLRISTQNKVPFSAKIFIQDKCFVHLLKDATYDNNCPCHLESQDTILRFQMTKDGLELENQVDSGSRFQNMHTFQGVQPNSSLYVESEANNVKTAYCDCKDCPDTALDLIQENPLYPFPEEGLTELIIWNTNAANVTPAVYLGNSCLVRLHFNGAAQWDEDCYYLHSKFEIVLLLFKLEDGRVKMRLPHWEDYIELPVQTSSDFLPGLSFRTWGGHVNSSYIHHTCQEFAYCIPKQTMKLTLWLGIGVLLIHLVMMAVVGIWDFCRQRRTAPKTRSDRIKDFLEMRTIRG